MHNLPMGVPKVVRRLDSLDRGISQNPLLASSLEKIFEFASLAKLSSTEQLNTLGVLRAGALCSDVPILTATFGLEPLRFQSTRRLTP